MMKFISRRAVVTLLLVLTTNTSIHAAVNPDAQIVEVRSDCTAQIENCFSTPNEAIDWMSTTRKPNASSPLTVKIYPGIYGGQHDITCDPSSGYTGFTSFEGSGNGQTVFRNTSFNSPLNVSSCTDLSFSDLTINGVGYGGVTWSGGGNSKWNNVDVVSAGRAWYEPVCGTERGSHYWTSSKLQVTAGFTVATTYIAGCDESWFFGSELTAIVPPGARGTGAVISATEGGIIHSYGSVLRLLFDGTGDMYAAHVGAIGVPSNSVTGGEIHIHGTGIDVISETGANVTALKASDGGVLHANETAYNLRTSGNITRLIETPGAAFVSAPYQWGVSQEAPSVTTVTGADTAVITNTSDSQPHIVISSDNCTSGWYDATAGACR